MISPTVTVTMNLDQARAVRDALDAYARLGVGQFSVISGLIALGEIPMMAKPCDPKGRPSMGVIGDAHVAVDLISSAMGYKSGQSTGIGHPHVTINTKRSWEVKKVIERALAEHHDPSPFVAGVEYDGLLLRYTTDPAPVAIVSDGPP